MSKRNPSLVGPLPLCPRTAGWLWLESPTPTPCCQPRLPSPPPSRVGPGLQVQESHTWPSLPTEEGEGKGEHTDQRVPSMPAVLPRAGPRIRKQFQPLLPAASLGWLTHRGPVTLSQIWVHSAHNASGYFTIYGDESLQSDHFNSRLSFGDTQTIWARTGYLGFLRRTELTDANGGQPGPSCWAGGWAGSPTQKQV